MLSPVSASNDDDDATQNDVDVMLIEWPDQRTAYPWVDSDKDVVVESCRCADVHSKFTAHKKKKMAYQMIPSRAE